MTLKNQNKQITSARPGLRFAVIGRALLGLVLVSVLMMSCKEDDGTTNEFANWQEVNDQYISKLQTMVDQRIAAGDKSWKKIRNWSLEASVAKEASQFIYVHVLTEGKGSGCPLYTDSVKVNYRGRLLPSPSYPSGKVFDQSYTGTLDDTAQPVKLPAGGGVVDGFSTALQNMHIGDVWEVYIPYQLAYRGATKGTLPAYSTLIFNLNLKAYYRPGQNVPDSRSGVVTAGKWIEK